ncbi:uncharacterized protein LOC119556596 isoform X2 [Drosophila subpulchrella]|uniref:uncharacterized protein LOC119556596 isoform X2 n=1 Tax=Drosophila subpulchrella TaxID=1486046 RepID=UPI0018A19AF9|nr:uncharacterized protein LOC119556596 isoform X2 [Drosophila subpulchrella]
MNIFLPYIVLLMILRITNARSMSFDLPYYGYDSYLDTYLDNTSDGDEVKCDRDGNAPGTVEPSPYQGYQTHSPYQYNPSSCGNNRDRDRDRDRGRDRERDRDNSDSSESDTSISRMKATHIAQNAAQVAKAANDAQAGAAQDASRQVKMQLADKAISAARAADAVLEGKQTIVENFGREVREAEAVVEQVNASLETSESNVDDACAAAKTAEAQALAFSIFRIIWI